MESELDIQINALWYKHLNNNSTTMDFLKILAKTWAEKGFKECDEGCTLTFNE